MIIQCEKCQTKFRLDDTRITDKGVKVRCTKCKHVFRVQRDNVESELEHANDFSLMTAALDDKLLSTTKEVNFVSNAMEDSSVSDKAEDFGLVNADSFDSTSISFETDDDQYDEKKARVSSEMPVASSTEVDFSSFDFGDNDAELTQVGKSPDEFKPAAPASDQDSFSQGLDFSDDDMFGTVVQAAPEIPGEAISFDFEGDSFAESMVAGGQDSTGKRNTLFSLDTPGDAPFNLDEIDFGDELTSVAVQQVNPEDLKPSQEILFTPLAEAHDKTADDELTRSFLENAADIQQDLPPLSITSRRKHNPVLGAVIAVIVVLVALVAGYFGYVSFSSSNSATTNVQSGKISIRGVKAVFVKNDEAGELLVITGEALNQYSGPRAALQVKATAFDAAGQSVAFKTAYCGNSLTDEQLVSLSLEKIEDAMANQFGDSLANMEVAPGKTIPFVVVLANLPKGAKDFGVQSAGSTVATEKPK